jgi:hypothetical protein
LIVHHKQSSAQDQAEGDCAPKAVVRPPVRVEVVTVRICQSAGFGVASEVGAVGSFAKLNHAVVVGGPGFLIRWPSASCALQGTLGFQQVLRRTRYCWCAFDGAAFSPYRFGPLKS